MITKFSMLRRRADVTPAQFSDHWRNRHVRVLIEEGGHQRYNKRYLQDHFLHGVLDFCSTAFDGFAHLVPQSDSMVVSGFQEDPLYLKYVRPDENKFLDVASCAVLYCESRRVLDPAPSGRFKFFCLSGHNPAQAREPFMEWWRERHPALVRQNPEFWHHVRGYYQHEVIPGATRGMAGGEKDIPESRIDAVDEYYFDSLEALKMAFAVHGSRQSVNANDGSLSFVAREEFIYDISREET
jgi:hypothetical protein